MLIRKAILSKDSESFTKKNIIKKSQKTGYTNVTFFWHEPSEPLASFYIPVLENGYKNQRTNEIIRKIGGFESSRVRKIEAL